MESKKITSWFNWEEWQSFVQDVYNDENDPSLHRRAFYRLLAWECRDSNLPAMLIGLKELLIAKLYSFNSCNASIEDTLFYQSSLAMNIVRFVNFVTEPYQKGTFAMPIKAIATQIGIPDWIVNLRHNATHFSLPSLEILENARDFLLKWVKKNYIDTYKEIPLEGSITTNIKSFIREVFSDYLKTRFQKVLVEGKKTKGKKQNSFTLDKNIEIAAEQFRNETFEILIENGYLVPSAEQLESMGILVEEFLEIENVSMPKPILRVWKEFLTFCNEKNLSGLLFQSLVNAFKLENDPNSPTCTDPLRTKFLLSWILYLIDCNSLKNEKVKQVQLEFDFNPKQLIMDILTASINKYTIGWLNQAKKMPWLKKSLNQQSIDKIISLVSILDENTSEKDQAAPDEDMLIGDDEDIEEFAWEMGAGDLLKSPETTLSGELSLKNSSSLPPNRLNSNWTLIDDPDWNHENLKLGLIPGQTYQNLNLQVIGDGLQEQAANQDHNLSINEAAMRARTAKKPKLEGGSFCIADLCDIDQYSMGKIKQDLLKNYWGWE